MKCLKAMLSVSALLGITLTKRHDMPMAGIPFHAAEGYLTKLLNQGYKVAICDQLETAQTGKLVKRGITRILTRYGLGGPSARCQLQSLFIGGDR